MLHYTIVIVYYSIIIIILLLLLYYGAGRGPQRWGREDSGFGLEGLCLRQGEPFVAGSLQK